MRNLLLLTLCCFACCFAQAQNDPQTLWDAGNKAYAGKDYANAISNYDKLVKLQPQNALVYYNLGNAYYRANLVGQSALAFERALFYRPDWKAARNNLELTRSRMPNAIRQADDIFFVKLWHRLTSAAVSNIWAVAGLLLFLLFLLALSNKYWPRRRINFPVQMFVFFPAVILLCIFMSFSAAQNARSSNLAVVMKDNAKFSLTAGDKKSSVLIPEATTVEVLGAEGALLHVTLPDKRNGYMQRDDLTFVAPKK